MNWKPKRRTNGVDEFMVQRVAQEILKELERNGWTKSEADMLPGCIAAAIKTNSERLEKIKSFTVCEITESSSVYMSQNEKTGKLIADIIRAEK